MEKGNIEKIDKEKFISLVQDILKGDNYFYLLQSPEAIVINNKVLGEDEISKWPEGRLFNKSLELRWKNGIYLKFSENSSGDWQISKSKILCWDYDANIPYKWQDSRRPEYINTLEYSKENFIRHLRFTEIKFIGGGGQ